MITLKDIRKSFTNGEETIVALNDVSLSIQENEFVAFMGSSGSGKSTMMNILGCLDTPDSGEYLLNGNAVNQLTDEALSKIRNEHIGFIFQTFHLLPKLDAIGNVKLPLRYSDVSEEEATQRAQALLEKVGLGHRMHHRPFEMSGGQRQRVAIARALINRPTMILADEPTGNLDSKTSDDIMALLTELHQQGQTIVMVTHEENIADYAQKVITMKDGQIISEKTNS
ncbi:MAG: ABC transporter ATP-binding protein [Pseudomonadota bacterium]|jgi:putative ABC transport system ATP-binding protein|nr:macrolide ABC transporter ATP-binding protein [Alteromonadaceae bacterium]MDY6927246.1 ABC transporter ATP-binding protein [Pseudomonadota bacterium]RPH14222.1 MAG: ABC transporter ATP-binding protein [Alteromonadaceae bacterium TMED7]|tara:strand:- start:4183 stop:4860 length:678 start_codon:yes stop_codon:yes gene_type:complete